MIISRISSESLAGIFEYIQIIQFFCKSKMRLFGVGFKHCVVVHPRVECVAH